MSSLVASQSVYECALNRITFPYWACVHRSKLKFKMASFIKAVCVCTIDRVQVTLVQNGDNVDLRATKWSGFMCQTKAIR